MLGHQGQEETGVGFPKRHLQRTYLETQEIVLEGMAVWAQREGQRSLCGEVPVQRGRGES